jgi:error-prone DNA polymerase
MGLRYVRSFGEREKARFAAAPGPYLDLDHFVRSTRLDRRALASLAQAGGLDSLTNGRRDALWSVRGLGPHAADPLPSAPGPRRIAFAPLSESDEVRWDYLSSQHSARGHPMARYRPELRARAIPCANEVWALPDRARIDYVGMVICRQRPGTKSGVTFYTLEDETGFVNVVVWLDVFERYAVIGKTASPLGITGKLQVAEGVTHLVADSLWLPDLRGPRGARPASRDFR